MTNLLGEHFQRFLSDAKAIHQIVFFLEEGISSVVETRERSKTAVGYCQRR
jgi:hypothetical protein